MQYFLDPNAHHGAKVTVCMITNSRLATFRRCPREHRLRYVDMLRPTNDVAPARDWGTVMHEALERDSADPITASALDEYAKAKALACYAGHTKSWTTIATEVEFRASFVDGESLGGKIDGIISIDGFEYGLEYKTTSQDITPGSSYWQRLQLDSQVSIYHDGAASLGYDIHGIVYDVIRRPTAEPYRATPPERRKYVKATGELYANMRAEDETPAEYMERIATAIAEDPAAWYQRATVVRIGAELDLARQDTIQTARAALSGTDYRNPDACFRFGRPCAYFALCTGSASSGDYYVAEKAHEELSNAS